MREKNDRIRQYKRNKQKLFKYLALSIARNNDITILEMNMGKDNIHLLIDCNTQHFIPDIVNAFKRLLFNYVFRTGDRRFIIFAANMALDYLAMDYKKGIVSDEELRSFFNAYFHMCEKECAYPN